MLRTLMPICALALALCLPSTARAATDPDEGPIICDVIGSIGFLAALVGGDASISASSDEEYGCPKSRRKPVRPTQPQPPAPRQPPISNQVLH